MTEQRSGGGAQSIRQRGDRPSENGLAGSAGEGRLAGAAAAPLSGSAAAAAAAAAAGSLQPCPGAAPGSRSSAVYVWSSTSQAEIIEGAFSPPEALTTWQSSLQSGEQRAKRGASVLPPPLSTGAFPSPNPLPPGAVDLQVWGSLSVVCFPVQRTPL